jgi:hypothetical protein
MLFSDYLFREVWVGVYIRYLGNGYLGFRSYVWTRLHCHPLFNTATRLHLCIRPIEEAVFDFWPTLVELTVCRLHSGLEGR